MNPAEDGPLDHARGLPDPIVVDRQFLEYGHADGRWRRRRYEEPAPRSCFRSIPVVLVTTAGSEITGSLAAAGQGRLGHTVPALRRSYWRSAARCRRQTGLRHVGAPVRRSAREHCVVRPSLLHRCSRALNSSTSARNLRTRKNVNTPSRWDEDEDEAEQQEERDAPHVMHPLRRRRGELTDGAEVHLARPERGLLPRSAGPRAWAATPWQLRAAPRSQDPTPAAPIRVERTSRSPRASSGPVRDASAVVLRVQERLNLLLDFHVRHHLAGDLAEPRDSMRDTDEPGLVDTCDVAVHIPSRRATPRPSDRDRRGSRACGSVRSPAAALLADQRALAGFQIHDLRDHARQRMADGAGLRSALEPSLLVDVRRVHRHDRRHLCAP